MTKLTAMVEYLNGLYFPVALRNQYQTALRLLSNLKLRSIELSDKGRSNVPMIFIEVSGKGIRATFKGIAFAKVDFNHVGKRFSEAYIRKGDAAGYPTRLLNASKKHAIIIEGE